MTNNLHLEQYTKPYKGKYNVHEVTDCYKQGDLFLKLDDLHPLRFSSEITDKL